MTSLLIVNGIKIIERKEQQYLMRKFPYQFVADTISLVGVGLLVIWACHGGLRKNIIKLFGHDATSQDLKDRVGHISDLLYYYAFIATALTIVISFLKMLPGKWFDTLKSYLPTHDSLLELLLNEIHRLIIFAGIYVYLIYNDGMGLKNKQIVLFPFWFLVTIGLEIFGRALTSLASRKILFTSAAFYLNFATVGLMLAHIFGYQPFKHI